MGREMLMVKKTVAYVWDRKETLDSIVAGLLALIPILQHYVGLIDNASTTIMLLVVPYLILRLLPTLQDFRFSNLRFSAVLIAFFAYKLVDHGTYFTEIAQVGLMCFFLLCVCQSCIDTRALKRTAVIVAMLAGVILLVQYFCYYILGFHLQMVPTAVLLPEASPWLLGVQTGKVSIQGVVSRFYRPAAFFLEPSHLFMYAFPGLFITLFDSGNKRKNLIAAVIISIGLVLCTSGMGIAVTIGAWGLFIMLRNPEDGSFHPRNFLRKQNLIFTGILLGWVIIAIIFVPFVRNSVVRIFNNPNGSTAIDGRTELALMTLEKMSTAEKIFGISDTTANLKFNMPGFMATLYKYGIVGLILSYWLYVKGLFKLNMPYFLYTVILLIASLFSAHTHGTFFMLFYVLLLKEGHSVSDQSWLLELVKPFVNRIKK